MKMLTAEDLREVEKKLELNRPDEQAAAETERLSALAWVMRTLATLFALVLFMLAVLSGIFSYHGMQTAVDRDGAGDLLDTMMTAPLAVALTVAIFILWLAIFRIARHLRTARGLVLAAFTLVVQCWCIGVSSFFSFAAMSFQSLIAAYLAVQLNFLGDQIDTAGAMVAAARGPAVVMESVAAEAAQIHAQEVAGEGRTGLAGAGPYSEALLAISSRMAAVSADLRSALSRTETALNGMEAHLLAGEEVLDARGDPLVRERAFKEAVRPVYSALREVQRAGLEGQIRSALVALRTIVPPEAAQDPSLRDSQRAGLLAQQARLQRLADELEAVLPAEAAGLARVERMQRVEVQDLVLAHWDKHIPLVLIAVGLDVAPSLLLALTLIGSEKRSPKKGPGLPRWRLPEPKTRRAFKRARTLVRQS